MNTLAHTLPVFCITLISFFLASASYAQTHFSDQTIAAGIAYYNTCGDMDKRYVVEAHGSGAGFFDADNDGDLDLYIANGSTLSTYQDQSGPGNVLYLNGGSGAFTDHTAASGSGHAGWGTGVAIADVDNDGYRDIYVSNYGPNVLFTNSRTMAFTDRTVEAGVGGDQFSASTAFFDYDNDGDLDLYVSNYVVFDAENRAENPKLCTFFGGLKVYCGPKGLVGAPDVLYRNEGAGHFVDVTAASGVATANRYYGLGVVPGDYDDDGLLDLFVANDETPNVLFHNNGDGTFRDVALVAGVAYNADGDTEAGMGVDFGDYDNDGDPDIYVTHFFTETNTLYRNEQGARFTDVTTTAGLAAPTVDLMGWGTRFFDYDNDGLLDLFVANGHVYPQVDRVETGSTYRQMNQLFKNEGTGRFEPVAAKAGLAIEKVSRGAAFGDYDDDGDVDIFVIELNDTPTLLRNEGGNEGNWLAVRLFGQQDNRDGIGARIRLRANGQNQWRDVDGAGSYLSHSDLRTHFGLGAANRIEQIDISWPNGTSTTLRDLPANKLLVVIQGGEHAMLEPGANPFDFYSR
jgi:hypothetical protein